MPPLHCSLLECLLDAIVLSGVTGEEAGNLLPVLVSADKAKQ